MKTVNQVRRIRLINPSLQMTLVWGFGAVSCIAITCQALIFAAVMTRFAAELPEGSGYVIAGLPQALLTALGISFILVVPALAVIGIRLTFRVAGPLYRMEQHLRAISAGEQVGPCRIRQEDELQEFCWVLNGALEAAAARGETNSDEGRSVEHRSAA